MTWIGGELLEERHETDSVWNKRNAEKFLLQPPRADSGAAGNLLVASEGMGSCIVTCGLSFVLRILQELPSMREARL